MKSEVVLSDEGSAVIEVVNHRFECAVAQRIV